MDDSSSFISLNTVSEMSALEIFCDPYDSSQEETRIVENNDMEYELMMMAA